MYCAADPHAVAGMYSLDLYSSISNIFTIRRGFVIFFPFFYLPLSNVWEIDVVLSVLLSVCRTGSDIAEIV